MGISYGLIKKNLRIQNNLKSFINFYRTNYKKVLISFYNNNLCIHLITFFLI